MKRQQASLTLSSGDKLTGDLIGEPLVSSGEMVFTTAMVGYSEAITDPSYLGQILVFSYPLIGNYGVPSIESQQIEKLSEGFESSRVHASAVIVTSDSAAAFHWNQRHTLENWLQHFKVPGITGIDTRHLVQLIRDHKHLYGRVEPQEPIGQRQIEGIDFDHAKSWFDPGCELILDSVSTGERLILGHGRKRIAVLDCGVKWNILRQLINQGCEVELLPWSTDLSTIDCSAWLISNGPGNPEMTSDLIQRVQLLFTQDRPVLGICLGHQILSLAAGAQSEKMPYGHRSHNQPVQELGSPKGHITSQNHGYVICADSVPNEWSIWFRNINDNTVEGIRHTSKPFAGVQFHPESAGGPRDTSWIIDQFVNQSGVFASQRL